LRGQEVDRTNKRSVNQALKGNREQSQDRFTRKAERLENSKMYRMCRRKFRKRNREIKRETSGKYLRALARTVKNVREVSLLMVVGSDARPSRLKGKGGSVVVWWAWAEKEPKITDAKAAHIQGRKGLEPDAKKRVLGGTSRKGGRLLL